MYDFQVGEVVWSRSPRSGRFHPARIAAFGSNGEIAVILKSGQPVLTTLADIFTAPHDAPLSVVYDAAGNADAA